MKKTLGIGAMILGVLAGGCGDKNLEDFQREQVTRDLGKLDHARGTYTGLLKRAATGEVLGALLIKFTPQTRPKDGSGSSTESTLATAQVGLRADFEFLGKTEYHVSIQDGLYNSDTGQFEASIPLSKSAGGGAESNKSGSSSESLDLLGNIANGQFSGTLRALGASQMGAEFTLSREGAPMHQLVAQLPKSNLTGELADSGVQTAILQTFVGKTEFAARTLPVNLTVTEDRLDPAREFFQIFSATRTVHFALNYGGALILDVPTMQWDQRKGSLSGSFASPGSAKMSPENESALIRGQRVTLDCQLQDGGNGLSCEHGTANGIVAKSHFTAGKLIALNDPFGAVVKSRYCAIRGIVLEDKVESSPTSPATATLPQAKPGKKPTPPVKPAPPVPEAKPQRPSEITVVYSAHSSLDDLLDLFLPMTGKSLQVTLDVHANQVAVVPFANAWYDPIGRIIEGAAEKSQGSDHFSFTLKCKGFSIADPSPFSCVYFSSHWPKPFSLQFSDPKQWKCTEN